MNIKFLVLTVYPGELFLLMKFFHFLKPKQTGAVGPLSFVIWGCPVNPGDPQLLRTWLWGYIYSCGNGNCSIHTFFISCSYMGWLKVEYSYSHRTVLYPKLWPNLAITLFFHTVLQFIIVIVTIVVTMPISFEIMIVEMMRRNIINKLQAGFYP